MVFWKKPRDPQDTDFYTTCDNVEQEQINPNIIDPNIISERHVRNIADKIMRTSRYESKSCCDNNNNIPARGELGRTPSLSNIKHGTAATTTTTTMRNTEIPSRDRYYKTEVHNTRKGTTNMNTNTRRAEDRYDTENCRKGIGVPRDRYNNNISTEEQFGGGNRASGDRYSNLRQYNDDAWRYSRNGGMPAGDRYELDRYEC